MVKIKKIKKSPAFVPVEEKTEEKPKYKQHNGMNLLEGDEALLLAQACKLDKEKKAAEKKLKAVKAKLKLTEKGEYTNKAGDVVKVSVAEKKTDIDPKRLHALLVKKKMLSRFWGCVKVQLAPVKKVIPESIILKMQNDLDPTIKCSFK